MDFDSIYEKYGAMLYKIAVVYTGNPENAEDVLQDVFIAYLKHGDRLQSEEHTKAWLIRVTHNKCINLLKSPHGKNIDIEQLQLTVQGEDRDQRLDVIRQISQLPAKYKSVIILYYYNELTIDEIAKILKTTKSAVKMRLKRGRDALKIQLEDIGNE